MNRRRLIWIAFLLILLMILGIFARLWFIPPPPNVGGTLLINRSENGMGRSYWLNPATGELTPVQGTDALGRPDLSPDGNSIVYINWPGVSIYHLTDDTVRQLTDVERDSDPNWSPDGRSIVFVSSRDFYSALFRYDLATGERQQLTDYQNDLEPGWSPDGQRIIFTTSRDGFQELYTMKPDGTDLQRLTRNAGLNDLLADYSPDGKQIAYMTNYSVGDNSGEIWLMNADGTDPRQVTNNTHDDRQPIWSPDGRYIAFTGGEYLTTSDIFVYDFLSDEVRQITTLPTLDANPIWSPDSQWIAFVAHSPNGQQSQIYVVRPDGSSLQPVVDEHKGYGVWLWMEAVK